MRERQERAHTQRSLWRLLARLARACPSRPRRVLAVATKAASSASSLLSNTPHYLHHLRKLQLSRRAPLPHTSPPQRSIDFTSSDSPLPSTALAPSAPARPPPPDLMSVLTFEDPRIRSNLSLTNSNGPTSFRVGKHVRFI